MHKARPRGNFALGIVALLGAFQMQILRLHIPHNAERACKLNVLAQPSTLRAATA